MIYYKLNLKSEASFESHANFFFSGIAKNKINFYEFYEDDEVSIDQNQTLDKINNISKF